MVTPVSSTNALKNIHGTIALAGAGKMGGAMLTGWLAQGLDPKRVVVIEPHPSAEIDALATKGIRLNPSAKDVGEVERTVASVAAEEMLAFLTDLTAEETTEDPAKTE